MLRGALWVVGVLLAVVVGISVYPAVGSPPTGTPADHHGKPARGPHIMPFGQSPAHNPPGAGGNGTAPAGAHLDYNGGRVVSNIQVVQVIYGAGTYLPQTTASPSPSVSSFYGGVTNSPYFDWLTEYDTNLSTQSPRTNQVIGRGSFGGQFTITPSTANNGSRIQDSNIQAELQAQISAGHLPQPTTDAAGNPNTLYAIYFRNGQSICSGSSCSLVAGGFCAYHGTIAASGSLPELYYSVHPDLTGTGGCGAGTDFQNTTSVASHEMIETVTDAEVGLAVNATGPPLAWYDQTNGEIGDICNAQQGTVTGGDGVVYTVQKEFSNVANDCIVTRSTSTNDFSVAASPTFLTLAQGASGTSTISTAVTSGSAQTVSLSVSGVPSGATATLSPTSVTAGGSSTLSVNAGTAAAGTYTLSIVGTGASATHSTTVTLGVTGSSGTGITNGGFESGLTGWTAGGGSVTEATSGCHTGSGCATLGATNPTNGDSTLAQTFTAPAGATGLSLWYKMTCPDTLTYDWADVTLRDNTAGTTAMPLGKVCTTNAWTRVTASITAGHTYRLTLLSHDDNYPADPTYTLYDDVALTGTTPTNDFSISASPTSLSLVQGASGTSTISTAVASGSAGAVSLAVSGQPSGATASFSSTSVTAGNSSTLSVGAGTASPGTYTLTVTGTEGSQTHSTTVALTITAPPPTNDFSISSNPTSLSLVQGASGTSTISTAVASGSAGAVSLAVSGQPSGATASLSSTSVTAGNSSTLSVGAGTTNPGTYTLTVTGTEGSQTHSTAVALTITAPPPPNDFSLSANPTSLSLVQGTSGTSTISTAVTSGSAQSITLTIGGVPTGASGSLSSGTVTAGGSSTLTVGAGTATPATYTLTITGTGASATHSTTVSLVVSSATPTPSPTPSPTATPPAFPIASGTIFAQDTFAGRSVASGWGTASDGHAWALTGGSGSSESVSGNQGLVVGSGSMSTLVATLGTATAADTEVVDRLTSNDYANDAGQVIFRASTSSTYYAAGLDSPVSGAEVNVFKVSGGNKTRVANIAFAATNGTAYWQRARITTSGSSVTIMVKVWQDGTTEPSAWNLTYTDTSPLPAGMAGIRSWDGGRGWAIDHFSAGSL